MDICNEVSVNQAVGKVLAQTPVIDIVVTTAGIGIIKPMAGAAAHSAGKYGLTGMMQSIREELKRTDIRITNLFLGGVDSPFRDMIDLRV